MRHRSSAANYDNLKNNSTRSTVIREKCKNYHIIFIHNNILAGYNLKCEINVLEKNKSKIGYNPRIILIMQKF